MKRLKYLVLRRYFREFVPLQISQLISINAMFFDSPTEMANQSKESSQIKTDEFSLYPESWNSNPGTLELLGLLIAKNRPQTVLETGIANGSSTQAILKAFADSGLSDARLFSVDVDPRVATQSLTANEQFNFILLDNKQTFSQIIAGMPIIDIFYHDSDHSYFNQMMEYELVWEKLSEHGILLSDDINWSNAFLDFCIKVKRKPLILCDSGKFCGLVYK